MLFRSVSLASLVAQEEQVDVNFVKNNFNNNAYRNNFGNNNYKPYPSNNGNPYGNSYGNSYNNNRGVSSDLESMLKDFITSQKAFNKFVEEKLEKLDNLAAKVDNLSHEVDFLKIIFLPHDVKEHKTLNAIQIKIDNNIRMLPNCMLGGKEKKERLKLLKIVRLLMFELFILMRILKF